MGTRPEIIKLAPVIHALEKYPDEFSSHILLTGQHKDLTPELIQFFKIKVQEDLRLMQANQSLNTFSGKLMLALQDRLAGIKPHMVLVQGDTNSVAIGGLSSFYLKIPVGHVEAGLRTGDRYQPFPEEMNRRLVSHLATCHFCPTNQAKENLLREGVDKEHIYVTGNTVIDAFYWSLQKDFSSSVFSEIDRKKKRLILVTAHRRENFGKGMENICSAVLNLQEKLPETVFIIPVHPNPNVKAVVYKMLDHKENIILADSLNYLEICHLIKNAYLILTDSGGVQEEAPSIGTPVLVLRDKTERPEVLETGNVCLVGTDAKKIEDQVLLLIHDPAAYQRMSQPAFPYGEGNAAEKIIQGLRDYFEKSKFPG